MNQVYAYAVRSIGEIVKTTRVSLKSDPLDHFSPVFIKQSLVTPANNLGNEMLLPELVGG
jgi:hypothetical protein